MTVGYTVSDWADFAIAVTATASRVLIGAFQVLIDLRSVRAEQETPVTWLVSRVFPAMVTCGSMVVAAATLLARVGGGLYWLVPGMLAAIVFGLVNAWVLLVGILR